MNDGDTSGVESLDIATLPMLIVVDLNVIVRLSLSCKFHLGRCCDGSRVTIHLVERACTL